MAHWVERGALPPTAADLASARRAVRRAEAIFNPDRLRLQRVLRRNARPAARLAEWATKRGLVPEGRRLGETTVLHSLQGCRAQPWHTDFDADVCAHARLQPLGLIWAIEEGTRFRIHPGAELTLDPGDVLVFEGACVHAGSAYPDRANTRVHMYIDSDDVRRLRDQTYPLDDDAFDAQVVGSHRAR